MRVSEAARQQRRTRVGRFALQFGLGLLGLLIGLLIWPVDVSVQQIAKTSAVPSVGVLVIWLSGCVVLLRSRKYRAAGIGLSVGTVATIAAIWLAGPCLVIC